MINFIDFQDTINDKLINYDISFFFQNDCELVLINSRFTNFKFQIFFYYNDNDSTRALN